MVSCGQFKGYLGCTKCEMICLTENLFERHLLTHLNLSEWEFECGSCGKRFVSEYRLDINMKVHTNERKYACQFCGNKYVHGHILESHLRNDHYDENIG